MYKPDAEIVPTVLFPPTTPSTYQVTFEVCTPAIVATYDTVWLVVIELDFGVIATAGKAPPPVSRTVCKPAGSGEVKGQPTGTRGVVGRREGYVDRAGTGNGDRRRAVVGLGIVATCRDAGELHRRSPIVSQSYRLGRTRRVDQPIRKGEAARRERRHTTADTVTRQSNDVRTALRVVGHHDGRGASPSRCGRKCDSIRAGTTRGKAGAATLRKAVVVWIGARQRDA